MKLAFYSLAFLLSAIGCTHELAATKDKQLASVETVGEELPADQGTAISAAEILIKPGDDLPAIFRKATEEALVTRIVFTPGDYLITAPLMLPRSGGLVIVDGQGANIKAKGGIAIFQSIPSDQSQAMDWNKTRFLIQDFGQLSGGERGIFIGSSFNTVIRNIEFVGQTVAAIDLVFCLMSTVEQVLVTNVAHDGIVLRSAVSAEDKSRVWPGTSYNNSQCNHTVVKSCRVYNKKGCTGTSFKVLQSTGVRLEDCISEGWPNDRAVFFDAKDCTTAKLFTIKNFHLEHLPNSGALCFRSNGSLVEVDGLFLQHGEPASPAIWIMTNGNYIFKNIPWWPDRAWVKSSHSPYVLIDQCATGFYDTAKRWTNADREGQPIYPKYITKTNKLVR